MRAAAAALLCLCACGGEVFTTSAADVGPELLEHVDAGESAADVDAGEVLEHDAGEAAADVAGELLEHDAGEAAADVDAGDAQDDAPAAACVVVDCPPCLAGEARCCSRSGVCGCSLLGGVCP